MEQLLIRFKRDLGVRGYSPETCKLYLRFCKEFLSLYSEDQINSETIKDYIYSLKNDKKLCLSGLRQAVASLKYFYTQTLGRSWDDINFPSIRSQKKLPDFFTPNEVFKILRNTNNLRNKTMLALAYSSGLRVRELQQLKISDIKRDMKRLYVRQGKGNKDRYTILSDICLKVLEKYWREYKPKDYLFFGADKDKPLGKRSIQHMFTLTKKRAGINRRGGIHTLRHSFATHFLETGGTLPQLQYFMGHSNMRTTMIYIHTIKNPQQVISPLDYYVRLYRK